MKIDIVTIFPEIFNDFINTSIIKKTIDKGELKINLVNLRDFADDTKRRNTDDTPFGGGAGQLMMFPPIYRAIKKLRKRNSKVIILTPQGETFNQTKAIQFSKEEHLIILCGRYEGFDERIFEFVDYEVSIGDYILMGGEIPAMAIIEATVRLIPGVITEESAITDTFSNGLLKYPQYTKPQEYEGRKVPEVLLSGDHAKIEAWRKEESLKRTKKKRPDLLKK